MDNITEARFKKLLSEWNRHQSLRQSAPSLSELAESRQRLDRVRFTRS